MTSFQVAVRLGKSTKTVHRMAERGELPSQKLPGPNGAYLFARHDIEAIARRQQAAS